MDFIAGVGTPIYAAAGGVVTFSEFHPEYGNMIEIDHGNDFTTRYAHASKLFVKTGTVVKRGEQIALSGATGRATGLMCISRCVTKAWRRIRRVSSQPPSTEARAVTRAGPPARVIFLLQFPRWPHVLR